MRCVISYEEYCFLKRIADRTNHEIEESAVDYSAQLEASLRDRWLIDPGFDEANGLSQRANRIALLALVISFAALVVSVVALFK